MRSRSLAGSFALFLAVAPGAALADPPAPTAPASTAPPLPKPAPAQPAPTAPATSATAKTPAKAAPKGKTAAAPKKKNKKTKDAPVTGPIATYPGFRMLDGGGSRVFVTLSKKLSVTEHKAEGKLTYRIAGAHVPTRTNRLPLLTGFFATPVSKATLVEQDGDVDLVIDVKDAAGVTHRVVETDKGAELQVDFPKLAAKEGDAAEGKTDDAASPASAGRPASAKSLDSKTDTAY